MLHRTLQLVITENYFNHTITNHFATHLPFYIHSQAKQHYLSLSYYTEQITNFYFSQLDVTDTVKTSHTQSLDTTEVSQMPRSESTI